MAPEQSFATVDAERPEQRDEASATDPVRAYLKEIGKTPLLTASQEVDLAMRMEGGLAASRLLSSIDSTGGVDRKRFRHIVGIVISIRDHQLDPSSGLMNEGIGRETMRVTYSAKHRAQSIAFLRRLEVDGRAAQARLIVANLRLVVSIAKRYVGRGMLFLDLVQEGNLGLIRATEKFDHAKGFKFSTYATWWIRQGVTRGIADQGRTIRMPVHMGELVDVLWRVQRQLVQDLGREPLPGEIGDRMGVTAGAVQEIRQLAMTPMSLETPTIPGEDARLEEFIEDVAAVAPASAAIAVLLREDLDSVLGMLTPREKRIIQLRFGLVDDRPLTLEEVGQEFHLTRERIRQIEAKALSKLRHPSSSQKLRDFME